MQHTEENAVPGYVPDAPEAPTLEDLIKAPVQDVPPADEEDDLESPNGVEVESLDEAEDLIGDDDDIPEQELEYVPEGDAPAE